MKYSKPPLDFKAQARLLITRGLQVDDENELINFLSNVNYYRLSGYLYTYKQVDPVTGIETLKPGTSFSTIKERYEFDRHLRLLLMDALEKIEVAILRTQFVEKHALRFGPFGYAYFRNYDPRFPPEKFYRLMDDIKLDEIKSSEEFIHRYRAKYTDENYLPLWITAELMSFGQLYTLYRNSDSSIKKSISYDYGLYPPVLDSWLHTLNYIRNSCAHHARLWNRILPLPPKLPDQKSDPNWYQPVKISNQRIFSVLTIIRYLLIRIDPQCEWHISVQNLLVRYSGIPLNMMGFPDQWLECKYWK